jgi:hypothetical protein
MGFQKHTSLSTLKKKKKKNHGHVNMLYILYVGGKGHREGKCEHNTLHFN